MTDISLHDLLNTAETAADEAAELLCKAHKEIKEGGLHESKTQTKGSIFDPVTEADQAAQDRIISVITDRFPTHRILAEEEGADALGDAVCPYRWIIDPLDGTRNFMHGKENFGTIVAVEKEGEFLASCMLLPMLGHRFTASKGGGAFADGKPVTLRNTPSMQDAILCSNITRRAIPDASGVLRTAIPPCVSVENYGCAVQAIGDILLGWNDGVLFKGLRIWDIAAGFLMLEEAGGRYRYEWMEPENPRGGIVSVGTTASIFDDVCAFAFEKQLA